MDFEAFTAGVEDGGIRDSLSGKILLCYILRHGGPMTFDEINAILQDNGWMNYFAFSQYMQEMSDGGYIKNTVDRDGYCSVTKKGIELVDELEKSVPYSIRQKAILAALKLRERQYHSDGCNSQISKNENGYEVFCSIGDGSEHLMTISLNLPEKQMAEYIKDRFSKDPLKIYRGLMELLDAVDSTDTDE